MKKSIELKMFIVGLIFCLCVMTLNVRVFATDDFDDLTLDEDVEILNDLNGNESNSNLNTTPENSNTNTNLNTNVIQNQSSNNTSVYNNTNTNTSNLPKTGIEDAVPTVLLVVVFVISAIYAYRKVQYYKSL